MTPPVLRLAALALLASVLGCSSSSSAPSKDASSDSPLPAYDGGMISIGVTGLDQTCASASDCVGVTTGSWSGTDPCCGHGCPTAAINVSAQAQYSRALTSVEAQCAAAQGGAVGGCGVDCIVAEVYCNAGTCAVCHAEAGAGDASAD